jgi:hypothetical protein
MAADQSQPRPASRDRSRTATDPGIHRGMGTYKYGYGRSLCCCSDLYPSLLAWNRGCNDAGIRATDRAARVRSTGPNESARPGTLFLPLLRSPSSPMMHPSIHPVLDPPEIAISPIPSGVAGWKGWWLADAGAGPEHRARFVRAEYWKGSPFGSKMLRSSTSMLACLASLGKHAKHHAKMTESIDSGPGRRPRLHLFHSTTAHRVESSLYAHFFLFVLFFLTCSTRGA